MVADLVGANLLRGTSHGGAVITATGGRIIPAEPIHGDAFVLIQPHSIALFTAIPEGSPRNVWSVTVADVIRAVDGPLVSVYGVRPESVSYNEKAEVLQLVWIAARSSLRDVFENVSLANLASASLPDSVTLVYMRPDGAERLQIRQGIRAHDLPMVGDRRRFDHNGRSSVALGPDRPAGQEPAELLFTTHGTNVRLSSSQLSLEHLLEYADQLVVA